MSEINNIRLEGIWKIIVASPNKNNYRVNRYVVFPWEISEGWIAIWMYANCDGTELKGGQICSTSCINNIQYEDRQLEISTKNSTYVFIRVN